LNDRRSGCYWCGGSFSNNRCFNDWRSGSFNHRGDRRSGCLDSRYFVDWFGGLLCRRLLGGLFLFNWSNLADEAGGFSFTLEHRHECFNQS
jgi:hypothetical protein